MRLKIEPVEKNEFIELLSSAPAADRKWVTPIFHNLKYSPKYYKVIETVNEGIIGLTYCKLINEQLDFSLVIFPKFQQQGFGKDLIFYIKKNFKNPSFTVAISNIRMLNLINIISKIYSIKYTNLDLKRKQFILNEQSE
jgi:hypothetical protein